MLVQLGKFTICRTQSVLIKPGRRPLVAYQRILVSTLTCTTFFINDLVGNIKDLFTKFVVDLKRKNTKKG